MTESQRTDFDALRSSGPTMPQFGPSRGTQQEHFPPAARTEAEPDGLLEWLSSAEAKQFEGQWVLLSDDFEVRDHARTLTELAQRNRNARTPIIVFVDPENTNLIA